MLWKGEGKGRDRWERKWQVGEEKWDKCKTDLETVVAKPASQNVPGGSRDHDQPSKHLWDSLPVISPWKDKENRRLTDFMSSQGPPGQCHQP